MLGRSSASPPPPPIRCHCMINNILEHYHPLTLPFIKKNNPKKTFYFRLYPLKYAHDLDLQINFRGHLKVKTIFKKWKPLFLTPNLKRAGNFTLEMIFKIFYCDLVKVKSRSNYKKVLRSCLFEFRRYLGIINVKGNFSN